MEKQELRVHRSVVYVQYEYPYPGTLYHHHHTDFPLFFKKNIKIYTNSKMKCILVLAAAALLPPHTSGTISCGNHRRDACQECGPDWTWCNGDCKWDSKAHKCLPRNDDDDVMNENTKAALSAAQQQLIDRAMASGTASKRGAAAAAVRARISNWWKDGGDGDGGCKGNDEDEMNRHGSSCKNIEEGAGMLSGAAAYTAAINKGAESYAVVGDTPTPSLAGHAESGDVLYPDSEQPGTSTAHLSDGKYTLRECTTSATRIIKLTIRPPPHTSHSMCDDLVFAWQVWFNF